MKAIVRYNRNAKGKILWTTEVVIVMTYHDGTERSIAVSKKPLGGKFSQEQAIREYKRFPARFEKIVQLEDVFSE